MNESIRKHDIFSTDPPLTPLSGGTSGRADSLCTALLLCVRSAAGDKAARGELSRMEGSGDVMKLGADRMRLPTPSAKIVHGLEMMLYSASDWETELAFSEFEAAKKEDPIYSPLMLSLCREYGIGVSKDHSAAVRDMLSAAAAQLPAPAARLAAAIVAEWDGERLEDSAVDITPTDDQPVPDDAPDPLRQASVMIPDLPTEPPMASVIPDPIEITEIPEPPESEIRDAAYAQLAAGELEDAVQTLVDMPDISEPDKSLMLGLIHGHGLSGIAVSKEKAVKYLSKAASFGSAEAMAELAGIYSEKEGGNPAEAFRYAYYAAHMGSAKGAYLLSKQYNERGCLEKALKWMSSAVAFGYPADEYELEKLRSICLPFLEKLRACYDYLSKIDLSIYPEAARPLIAFRFRLGCAMLDHGAEDDGVAHIIAAAKGGSSEAMETIAELFETGRYFPRDPKKAAKWRDKAKAAG